MTLPIDFTKEKSPASSETLGLAAFAHEVLRKAIACCDGDDSIVLTLEAAMGLVEEWDRQASAHRII